MSNLAIAVFLLLFGVLGLVSTKVPDYILPLVAIVAGLAVLAGGFWNRKP